MTLRCASAPRTPPRPERFMFQMRRQSVVRLPACVCNLCDWLMSGARTTKENALAAGRAYNQTRFDPKRPRSVLRIQRAVRTSTFIPPTFPSNTWCLAFRFSRAIRRDAMFAPADRQTTLHVRDSWRMRSGRAGQRSLRHSAMAPVGAGAGCSSVSGNRSVPVALMGSGRRILSGRVVESARGVTRMAGRERARKR